MVIFHMCFSSQRAKRQEHLNSQKDTAYLNLWVRIKNIKTICESICECVKGLMLRWGTYVHFVHASNTAVPVVIPPRHARALRGRRAEDILGIVCDIDT